MHRLSLPPLLLAAAFAASTPGAPAPTTKAEKVEPPRLRFLGVGPGNAGTGHVLLRFEASNPNAAPLPYVGYLASSFAPPLKEGTIAPLYRLEYRKANEWKAHGVGWCGTGRGPVQLPARGKATFDVPVTEEGWEAVRVGLTWFESADRQGAAAAAWSEPVSHKDVRKPAKP